MAVREHQGEAFEHVGGDGRLAGERMVLVNGDAPDFLFGERYVLVLCGLDGRKQHCGVDLARIEMGLEVVAVGCVDLDLGSWMQMSPASEPTCKRMGGVRLDASDPDHAREARACRLELVPNGIVEVHDLTGAYLQEQSGLGRRHAFLGALKEHGAVFALEFLNASRERRLRDVQALGGAGEAACFADGEKCLQAADVHGSGPKWKVA